MGRFHETFAGPLAQIALAEDTAGANGAAGIVDHIRALPLPNPDAWRRQQAGSLSTDDENRA